MHTAIAACKPASGAAARKQAGVAAARHIIQSKQASRQLTAASHAVRRHGISDQKTSQQAGTSPHHGGSACAHAAAKAPPLRAVLACRRRCN